MMGMSLPHLLIAGVVILVLFGGKGKISDIMGDFAKGIKSFKKGMNDDDEAAARPSVVAEPVRPAAEPVRSLDHRAAPSDVSTETRRVG